MNKIFRIASVFALACAALVYTGCTKDFSQDINGVNEKADNALVQIESLKTAVAKLEAFQSQAEVELAALKADKADKAQVAADIQAALSTANANLETAKNALSAAIATAKGEAIAEAEQYAKGLFDQAEAHIEQAVSSLTAAYKAADQALSTEFTAKYNELKSSLAALTGRVEKLENRIQAINWVKSQYIDDNDGEGYGINTFDGKNKKAVLKASFKVVPESAAAALTADKLAVEFIPTKAWAIGDTLIFNASHVFVAETGRETGILDLIIVVDSAKVSKPVAKAVFNEKRDLLFALKVKDAEIATDIESDLASAEYWYQLDGDILEQAELYHGSEAQETNSLELPTLNIAWDDVESKTIIDDTWSVKFADLTIDEVCAIFDLQKSSFKYNTKLLPGSVAQDTIAFNSSNAVNLLPISVKVAEAKPGFVGSTAALCWYIYYDAPAAAQQPVAISLPGLANLVQQVNIVASMGTVFTSEPVSIKWDIDSWDATQFPIDDEYKTLEVDGEMTDIAARAGNENNKLASENLHCYLTPEAFAKLKTFAAAKQVDSCLNIALHGLAEGADPSFVWVDRTHLDFNLNNGSAWVWPAKDSTVVYVNAYFVSDNQKYYVVGVPVTWGTAPKKNQPVVTLTGEIGYRADSATFQNMLDDVIAEDVIAALDAPAKDVYADFLANLVGTTSVAKTGYSAGKQKNTAAQVMPVKLFNQASKADSSLFVLKVKEPNTNALYGKTYKDSVCYSAWGLNFPVKFQATVKDAPKYAFKFQEDSHVTITDAAAKKGVVDVKLVPSGIENFLIPETINLKQLVHITRPAGAPSIVSAEYPLVWIKVKEVVDTAYVSGDTLAMYSGISFNEHALGSEMSYSKNAHLYSTIGGLENEFLLSQNCPIAWNGATVNRFTLKLALMVDAQEIDECTLTFKTTNPVLSVAGKAIEVPTATVTEGGVNIQPIDVHGLLNGLQSKVLYQPETNPTDTVNVFGANGYVNRSYTQTTAHSHYYTYGSNSTTAYTGNYSSDYWAAFKAEPEGYAEAYPANGVKYYFGVPSEAGDWYAFTSLVNNRTGVMAFVANKAKWTWSGTTVADKPISQNADMFVGGLEYHAVYYDCTTDWNTYDYGTYDYTHYLYPYYDVDTDAYITLLEGTGIVNDITVNIPVVVTSRYTGYVDVEAAAPKFEANNVESAIKVTFKK